MNDLISLSLYLISFSISFMIFIECMTYYIIGTFNAAQKPVYILYNLRMFFEKKLGTYWAKPFLSCYKCMPSIHVGLPMLIIMLWVHFLDGGGIMSFFVALVLPIISTSMVSGKVSLKMAQLESINFRLMDNVDSSVFNESLESGKLLINGK